MPGFPVTGCFGKLPARGDFLLRGLPRSFADPWHGWLADGLQRSRDAMGAGWLPAYLNAPIWRFALAAGVCGPQPAVGVLMASVDKAGRYFPLTVAALPTALPPEGVQGDAVGAAWFDAADELAFGALAADLDVEDFAGRVTALAAPPALPPAAPIRSPAAGAWAGWGTPGGEGVAAQSLVTDGLPDPAGFAGFLAGFGQAGGGQAGGGQTGSAPSETVDEGARP